MPSHMKKRRPMEAEPGEGKAHEMKESPEEEVREGSESEEGHYGKTNRKRSAKGAKKTKAPMDGEGCGCGGKKGATCDGNCGSSMKKRSDALTPQEYLAACDLGIQGRNRSYIRARLDTAQRLDLKCGKGSISQGEKCHKGPAQKADPKLIAASQMAARVNKSGSFIEFSSYNKKTGQLAPKNQGPSATTQLGQAAKGVGLGVLEAGKWVSGYNIGKTIASGVTQGKNQSATTGSKAASIIGSGLLLGPIGAIGAARRLGGFGSTDLQQNASNQKKERKWRRSVGYRDGGTYAKGFTVDYDQLAV